MRTLKRAAQVGAVAAVVAALGVASLPRAQAETGGRALPDRAMPARSVGSPTDGFLVGGVPLRERTELRLRWPDGPRWALPQLVTMLERAARRVDRRYPGSVLLVGDLSQREGGSLAGHASHRSGRDADVAFYYADPEGNSIRTERLLPVRSSGLVSDRANLHFDEARNWALVESFLTDAGAMVQQIFVAAPLRRRLLDYARQHRTSGAVLERAVVALRQPTRGHPHDDHFHLRIACPRDQRDVCVPGPLPAVHERTARLDR